MSTLRTSNGDTAGDITANFRHTEAVKAQTSVLDLRVTVASIH